MGFKAVYASLRDIFPQVDARVLKAVAIEHSKDVEAAVNDVLTEVIPFMYKTSISPAPNNSSPGVLLNKGEGQDEEQKNSKPKQVVVIENLGPSEQRFLGCEDPDNTYSASNSDETHLNGALDQSQSEVSNFSDARDGNNQSYRITGSPELVPMMNSRENNDEVRNYISPANSNAVAHGNGEIGNHVLLPINNGSFKVISSENFGELGIEIGAEQHNSMPNMFSSFHENGIDGSPDDDRTSLNSSAADDSVPITSEKRHEVESCMHSILQEVYNPVIPPIFPFSGKSDPVSSEGHLGSAREKSLSGSPDLPLKQDCSVYETIGIEEELIYNSLDAHSGQVCRVDFLEKIIEVAKNNKKTMFSAMEAVIDAMKEVEMMEKAAELAQKEAANGGLDILLKVEELKQMLVRAKEANDMHAGEMHGEKAILATEVREFHSRLLSLSDERDKYLQILDEMRQSLEIRLVMAEELRKVAEQEKMDKEQYAQRAVVEQEALMVKVVEESKMLQQQAEENSKLQEFLMDRGHVVDTLQGEISVICQNVKLLKEKFDERVPFSKSLSSSQTRCIVASSGSSQKSTASDLVSSDSSTKDVAPNAYEKDRSSDNSNKRSPPSSINGSWPECKFDEEKKKRKDEYKALVDDGWDWDIFDEIPELDR